MLNPKIVIELSERQTAVVGSRPYGKSRYREDLHMKRHVLWLIVLGCVGTAFAQPKAGERVDAAQAFRRGTHDGTEVARLSQNLPSGGLCLKNRASALIDRTGRATMPYQQRFQLPRPWSRGSLELTFTLRPPEGMPNCSWILSRYNSGITLKVQKGTIGISLEGVA